MKLILTCFIRLVKKITEFITIKIGRKKIKQENHVRFLDVLLDSTLTWKTHIVEISKKLSIIHQPDKLNSFPAIAFELFSSMAKALGL